MRRASILLSMLVLVAMILAACGGGATSTNVAGSPPPVTVDATEDMTGTATESTTEEATATETAGVPVTGDVNPARISNQLDFTVWSQDGEQIGDVEDMVLNLDDPQVAYVIVGTGGFLDLGDREVLVPWEALELQTGTGDTTGGQQNAFILQTDVDTFRNAPDFDLGNLPERGQPVANWDVDIRTYWESGGTAGGAANTPAASDATATTDPAGGQATATTDPAAGQATATTAAGAGTGQATATTEAGQGTGTGTEQGQALQGVVLANEVLGSSINWGAQGQGTGTGQGQGQATATTAAGAGTGQATATPGGAAESTPTTAAGGTGTDQGNTTGTIEDMIVEVDTGDILYIVIRADFAEGERWIPVPLSLFRWNGAAGAFTLNADTTVLQTAPAFENGQFPDTTSTGWNAEIDTFWQNNAGSGTGSGTATDAQATPTP